MAMTKRELIQFMDELVELASEENKTRNGFNWAGKGNGTMTVN